MDYSKLADIEGVKILFSGDKLLDLNGVSNVNFPVESGKIVFVNISVNNETTCQCFQVIVGSTMTFQTGDALFTIRFYPGFVSVINTNWTPINVKSVAVL